MATTLLCQKKPPLLIGNMQTQLQLYRWVLLTTVFAFSVAMLGAYTRLTDAGLGCPDWPGCYGQLMPSKELQNSSADFVSVSGFNLKKAWTEMAHRYIAGFLGILIFFLGVRFYRLRKTDSFLQARPHIFKIACLLVGLVIFQALLGMWTVTLKLLPVVVMGHLLGGFTMLSLLYWLSLMLKPSFSQPKILPSIKTGQARLQALRIGAGFGLIVLILQLFLGGWTSANYAALVCLDFPACFAGQYFPEPIELKQAFNFFSERNTATITIHMFHRIGALITAVILYSLFFLTYRSIAVAYIRKLVFVLSLLLAMQIFLGIMNVLALLPLFVAVMHHTFAALLLLGMVNLNYQLYYFYRYYPYEI